jgi:pseudouridine-5'-phosphate glycosidase
VAPRRGAARGRRARGPGGVGFGARRGGKARLSDYLEVAGEVASAIERGAPVVALETSIVGQGLPSPHNLRAARGCEAAIREEGAVPATVAVLDGRVHVGLSDAGLERIAAGSAKVSKRDLGPALARRTSGATTVAAAVHAAAVAGIRFFATGGIGGVHRGHPEDVSADLEAIAASPVAVFCAGAKIILDLGLTLERLETLSVPVIGYGTDEFPAFYTRRSGCRTSARADTPEEAARMLEAIWWDGRPHGAVVAIPPPRELAEANDFARRAAEEMGDVKGAAVTPALLARIAELSEGRSLDINVELVINNARIAARVARVFSQFEAGSGSATR